MYRVLIIFISLSILACSKDDPKPITGLTSLKKTNQRSGDAAKGYKYLTEGDYLASGIPLDLYKLAFGSDKDDLGRQGINAGINYQYTAVKASNGVNVVSQTCLRCHSTKIDNDVIIGLGNNLSNYTIDESNNLNGIESLIKLQYGQNSKELQAAQQFLNAGKAISTNVITEAFGVNPADKVFAVLAGHRNPNDLTWNNSSSFSLPKDVVPTDVPAWWLLKKKNALYYNGLGQGDFARLSIASALLTAKDTVDFRKADNNFADVIAYINSINAPAYPFAIDKSLADKGKSIFNTNCATCHGKDGSKTDYPNFLVSLDQVGTDPTLAQLYKTYPQYHEWYNKSWFNKAPFSAQLIPQDGYIAPPLDGIWATAPYFHNGSVPNLASLLNSISRPNIWKRNSDLNKDYDQVNLGWPITKLEKKNLKTDYDTNLIGYGNKGHTYGDALSDKDRKALLEFLKTL